MAKQKFTKLDLFKPINSAQEGQGQETDGECEPSVVPETSPSVSRTIGTSDTSPVNLQGDVTAGKGSKPSFAEVVSKEQTKKPFAALFQDNRNPNKGISLSKVSNANGVVEVAMEDLDNVVSTWGFALIGYVAGGFPGIEAVRRLANSWKVPYKFYVHKSGWLVFRFEIHEDRDQVLQGGPYLIYGRPLILKEMPQLFEFGPCTLSVIPVWVTLPGLPLDMWNAKILGKICSEIGEPICTDAMTSKKERISYARVLVHVDLSKELTTEVKISLPNGRMRMQYVTYENLPKFCSVCKIIGHSYENCFHNPKNTKKNVAGEEGKGNAGADQAEVTVGKAHLAVEAHPPGTKQSKGRTRGDGSSKLDDGAKVVGSMHETTRAVDAHKAGQPAQTKQRPEHRPEGAGKAHSNQQHGVVSTCTGGDSDKVVGKGGQPGSESETVGGNSGQPETLKGLVIDPGTRQLAIEANQLAAPQDSRVASKHRRSKSLGDRLSMDPNLKGAGTEFDSTKRMEERPTTIDAGVQGGTSKLAQPQEVGKKSVKRIVPILVQPESKDGKKTMAKDKGKQVQGKSEQMVAAERRKGGGVHIN